MEEQSPFGSADGFYTSVHFIDCHEVSTNTTADTWGRSKSIPSGSAFWSNCPQERGRDGHSSLGRTLPALQEHRAAGPMPRSWDGHSFACHTTWCLNSDQKPELQTLFGKVLDESLYLSIAPFKALRSLVTGESFAWWFLEEQPLYICGAPTDGSIHAFVSVSENCFFTPFG